MADSRNPTYLRFPPAGSIPLAEAEARAARRDRNIGRLILVVGLSLLVVTMLWGGAKVAGAQGAEVDYTVGDMRVVSMLHRNPSCSITRNFINQSPVPLELVARVEWDGHAASFPNVGDSPYTGPQVLQPGEQVTAVWNGVDRTPPTLDRGPVRLLIESRFTDGSGAFAAGVEQVRSCDGEPTPEPPPTTETTAPPVTEPPTTVPETIVPPTTAPETTTTVDLGCTWDPDVQRYRDSATGQFCSGEMTTLPSEPGVELVTAQRSVLPHTAGRGFPAGQVTLGGFVLILAGTVALVGRRRAML